MLGRSIVSTAALLVALPATAVAGGWATTTLSSTPDGTPAGKPWVVDIQVLQHGRTPAEGLEPTVTVTSRGTGAQRTSTAAPTGMPGVYRARVVFPRAGEYEYAVETLYGQQTYAPVRIGETAPPATAAAAVPDEGFPWPAFIASLAAGALAAAATSLLRRRGAAAAS